LLTFGIALPRAAYPGTTSDVFWHRLEDRMRGLTGVRGAALFDDPPMSGNNNLWAFDIVGRTQPAGEPRHMADQVRVVGDAALATLDARIVRGRALSEDDVAGAANVAMINQSFAARYFAGEDPIGRQIVPIVGDLPAPRTIVGVFGDIR